jgi:Fe2+ or Zn2+ uptake regulation protein
MLSREPELIDALQSGQRRLSVMREYHPAVTPLNVSFDTVYTVLHLFHRLNVDAQQNLREGVLAIEAEETKQGEWITRWKQPSDQD